MDISVIVPLLNEKESLPELLSRITAVMKENGFSYEVIMVDDGSDDGSWEEILRLASQNPAIHGIRFRRNYGKSAALFCAFERAQGEVVFTMDADLQDFPEEIPQMYEMVKKDGVDKYEAIGVDAAWMPARLLRQVGVGSVRTFPPKRRQISFLTAKSSVAR